MVQWFRSETTAPRGRKSQRGATKTYLVWYWGSQVMTKHPSHNQHITVMNELKLLCTSWHHKICFTLESKMLNADKALPKSLWLRLLREQELVWSHPALGYCWVNTHSEAKSSMSVSQARRAKWRRHSTAKINCTDREGMGQCVWKKTHS